VTARVVLGVDGGGTFTRALIADLDGRVLASAETGGSNPSHHPRAEENAREAIQQVLAAAGCEPGQVVAVVAGFAGLDRPRDQKWADRFTAVPGLVCPRLCVNDAVIAHAGALRSQPGIIAISGNRLHCLRGDPVSPIPVALVGSVIRSPFLQRAVKQTLARKANRDYLVVEPALSSVQGAILMALERCGRGY
jgi:hypothetical protein